MSNIKQVAIAVIPTTYNSLREIANDSKGKTVDAAVGIPGDVFKAQVDGWEPESAGIFVLVGAGLTRLPFNGYTIGDQTYTDADGFDNFPVVSLQAYPIANTPGFAELPAQTRAGFSEEVHTLMGLASIHENEQPLIENGIPGFVRHLGRVSEAEQHALIAALADRHNLALLHE